MAKLEQAFFEAEERCGHLVTPEVKKLWAVELDLLEQVRMICEKHHLTYFAAGGTLLGAARHQGFIPWDDDIDLHMPAEDFDRFCKIAEKELKEPYYIQYWGTESQATISHARIRRSDTTGCTAWEYKYCGGDYNCGIFADIFPIYNVPDSKLKRSVQCALVLFLKAVIVGGERLNKNKITGVKGLRKYMDPCILLWKLFTIFTNGQKLRKSYLKLCGWEKKPTRHVGMTSFKCRSNKLIWNSEYFSQLVDLPFENTTVPCPKEYDLCLKQQYGDWKTPVKNLAYHEMEVFDAEVSYKEKLKR